MEIPIEEFFEAYHECRRNKRWKNTSMEFELDYEKELMKLYREVNNGSYKVGRSVAFVVSRPVYREIFAAHFRDRVVHHLLLKKLNVLFEKEFIYDCYACRKGKGTLFGVKRLNRFIRQCSENYTKDCYILKLDIQAFFMNINRSLLWNKLQMFINEQYIGVDKLILMQALEKIILNDAMQGVELRSTHALRMRVPKNKKLENAPHGCGIPAGNLTSQVFANFYMSAFDHYIKSHLRIRHYGRYVDDFVIVHNNKEYLKNLIPKIRAFLKNNLGLTLHPNKVYLQHYVKGVKFLGAVIKPYRMYISNRTMGAFNYMVHEYNSIETISEYNIATFINRANSYLGFMVHHNTYKRRVGIVKVLNQRMWKSVATSRMCSKFVKVI